MNGTYTCWKFMDWWVSVQTINECCVTVLNLLKGQAERMPALTCILATEWQANMREGQWQELALWYPNWAAWFGFYMPEVDDSWLFPWTRLYLKRKKQKTKNHKLKINGHYQATLLGSGKESYSGCLIIIYPTTVCFALSAASYSVLYAQTHLLGVPLCDS